MMRVRAPARPWRAGGWTLAALPLALTALLAVLALSPGVSLGAEPGGVPVPAYRGYVTDEAGVLGETRRAQLEAFLDEFHRKTGAQFAVLTVATTEPEAPESYKVRVFQAWGIGSRTQDDGLLLLVAMKEHRLVFETGYGLEGTLPDGWQGSMLRELVVPRMRAGDVEGGITAAVLAAAQRVAAEKGVALVWNGRELRYDGSSRKQLPHWVVLVLLFLVMMLFSAAVRRRGFYGRMGPWIGGGWGGGFSGGGGGWGGGGGSSFGGFGGGGSGGGGGGASW
jgi:uncharacterized protein